MANAKYIIWKTRKFVLHIFHITQVGRPIMGEIQCEIRIPGRVCDEHMGILVLYYLPVHELWP